MTPFAEYVWAAYAVSVVALTLTAVFTLRSWQKAKRSLKARGLQDSETNL